MAEVVDPFDLPRRMHSAARIIRDQARLNAAAFSRRIPAATDVHGGDSIGDFYIEIRTNGQMAPNAAPFEWAEHHPLFGSPHGRNAGTRHRYYDHKDWYRQPYRPYMSEAVIEKAEEAVEELANVIDDWCHDLGFH